MANRRDEETENWRDRNSERERYETDRERGENWPERENWASRNMNFEPRGQREGREWNEESGRGADRAFDREYESRGERGGGTRREAGGGGFETWGGRGNYAGAGGPGMSGRGDQGSYQGQGGGYEAGRGASGYQSSGWGGGRSWEYPHTAPQSGSRPGRYAGRGPKNWTRSDERIREDVNERLTQHPDIDASDIEVEVQNGEVTLKGTVDERYAKRAAEDVVEGVLGVKQVHNHLRVEARVGGRMGEQAQGAPGLTSSAGSNSSTSSPQSGSYREGTGRRSS